MITVVTIITILTLRLLFNYFLVAIKLLVVLLLQDSTPVPTTVENPSLLYCVLPGILELKGSAHCMSCR